MYKCSKCGQTMSFPLDRCPGCGVLLSGVKCQACNYVGGKSEFINNGHRCPKCGSSVTISSNISMGSDTPASAPPVKVKWTLGLALATAGIMLLGVACIFTFVFWNEILKGRYELYMWIGLLVLGIAAFAIGITREVKKSLQAKTEVKKGRNISLWAQDEATAKQLGSDRYFLIGALMADSSSAAKTFLEALDKGGSLSYTASPNSSRGGFDVEINLT